MDLYKEESFRKAPPKPGCALNSNERNLGQRHHSRLFAANGFAAMPRGLQEVIENEDGHTKYQL